MKKKKINTETSREENNNFLIAEKDCVIILDDTNCRRNTTMHYLHDRDDEHAIKMFLNAKLNNLIG